MNKTTLLPLLAALLFLTTTTLATASPRVFGDDGFPVPLEGYRCGYSYTDIGGGCGKVELCWGIPEEGYHLEWRELEERYYQTDHFIYWCDPNKFPTHCELELYEICHPTEEPSTPHEPVEEEPEDQNDYKTVDGDDIAFEEYPSTQGCSSTTTTPLPLLAIALGFFLLVYVRTNKD